MASQIRARDRQRLRKRKLQEAEAILQEIEMKWVFEVFASRIGLSTGTFKAAFRDGHFLWFEYTRELSASHRETHVRSPLPAEKEGAA
ncbi:MAG TPA: hypothetical protein VKT78_11330 [Fimbriimonadaceae bacterium]|nr:hypothetical protein [Fimbriimonadaceae bacterium]